MVEKVNPLLVADQLPLCFSDGNLSPATWLLLELLSSSASKQNIYFEIKMSVLTVGTDILVVTLIKKLPLKSPLILNDF